MSDPNRMRYDSNEFYFKSRRSLRSVFGRVEPLISQEIADRCNVEPTFSDRSAESLHFPGSSCRMTGKDPISTI